MCTSYWISRSYSRAKVTCFVSLHAWYCCYPRTVLSLEQGLTILFCWWVSNLTFCYLFSVSAYYYFRQNGGCFRSVYLFVYLSATRFHKNFWTDSEWLNFSRGGLGPRSKWLDFDPDPDRVQVSSNSCMKFVVFAMRQHSNFGGGFRFLIASCL